MPPVVSDYKWMRPLTELVLTLAIAGAGGLVFFAAGLPAPWLSGPAVGVGSAAIAGARLSIPGWLRHVTLVFLGASMGSAVTPQTLSLLAKWPVSILGVAVSVTGIMVASSTYLMRVHGYDRTTARLAAVPGALTYVMALAAESQCDRSRVVIIQMFRLAALLVCLPTLLALFGFAPAALSPASATTVRLHEVGLLFAAGLLGAFIFSQLKAPAAPLFGSLVTGAILYGSGILSTGVPAWLMLPSFVIIGAMVGTNFRSVDRALLADTALAGIGCLIIGAAVAMLCALPMAWLLGLPVAKMWLSYAPGGVDVMTIMALALGLDPAFVGGHHVVRFLGLGLFAPMWLRN